MRNLFGVDVLKTINELLEVVEGHRRRHANIRFYIVKELSAVSILHEELELPPASDAHTDALQHVFVITQFVLHQSLNASVHKF